MGQKKPNPTHSPEHIKMLNEKRMEHSIEERREWGRQGGIASGESKRRRKRAREILEEILELPARGLGIEPPSEYATEEERTVYEVILAVQAMRAAAGSVDSAKFCRDTVGDAPVAEAAVAVGGFDEDAQALLEKVANRLKVEE